jgi:hypothetical protein
MHSHPFNITWVYSKTDRGKAFQLGTRAKILRPITLGHVFPLHKIISPSLPRSLNGGALLSRHIPRARIHDSYTVGDVGN